MEYEIRFYYSKNEYDNMFKQLSNIKDLSCDGRKYEKTIQYNHPNKEFDFYSKKIDGRFRVRISKGESINKCMISWKRRLGLNDKINTEEEIELNIEPNEYDNLLFLLNNVLHLKEIESYERYRTTFSNKDVEIALDEYPFGLALEIEAKGSNPNKIIDKYINLLGLSYDDSYKLSWDDKYAELCKEQGFKIEKHVLFNKKIPIIK